MKAIDITFCVYPVTNLKVSRDFYENALGFKATSIWVQNDTNGMIEYDIGPATFAIGAGADNFKVGSGGGVVAFEVDDFDAAIKKLKEKKCVFISEPSETPVCFMAVICDPDKNKLIIHKRKKK